MICSMLLLSILCHCRQMDWDIDCVVPVPDGARPTAIQISSVLGLPYREGLVKNRYVGRTFIMPDQVPGFSPLHDFSSRLLRCYLPDA